MKKLTSEKLSSPKNVWVGIGRNSQINRILFLSTDSKVKKGIIDSISEDFEEYYNKKHQIEEFSKKSLVLEEKFYYKLEDIDEDHNLYNIKNKVFSNNSLHSHNKVISLKKIKNETIEDKDIVKFLLVDNQNELIFLSINSRKTIKDSGILNLKNITDGGIKVGINSTYMEVDSGISIPNSISAIYNIAEKRLYVLNVIEFEKMVYVNEIRKRKAEINLDKFIDGKYTISSDKWNVEFENSKTIRENILNSSRAINRISSYENDSSYDIAKIKYAVDQLSENEKKVEFDYKNNKVRVNPLNYKTFIGIIHNGIVKRLISGDVEVVL
ncbi:MAG: hypothetical protein NUK57_04440 [Gudongella sp.]|nr:hypothetical protein [Gudongella sp.]